MNKVITEELEKEILSKWPNILKDYGFVSVNSVILNWWASKLVDFDYSEADFHEMKEYIHDMVLNGRDSLDLLSVEEGIEEENLSLEDCMSSIENYLISLD